MRAAARPIADTLVPVAAGILTIALVGIGTHFGGRMLFAALAAACLAGFLALVSFDLAKATLAVTLAFAFFTATPELRVGPVRVRVALLILALLLSTVLELSKGKLRIPWWITSLSLAMIVVTVLVVAMPIDTSYLSGRLISYAFNAPSVSVDISDATAQNIRLGASYLLSVVGISLAVVACSRHFRRAPLWIAIAFVVGNALSAFVAFTDFLGYTSLSALFGGCGVPDGRACGFSSHPVILTFGTVYSTALAAWLAVRPRSRLVGVGCFLALTLGTYASGTRGGVLCVLLAGALSVLLIPQYRRQLHVVTLGAAAAVAFTFVLLPSLGHALLVKTRLVDAPDASGSNLGRIQAMTQGLHDFAHSPIFGIGLGNLGQAHNGYIQSLAAGGIILLVAMVTLNIAALYAAWRMRGVQPMALALTATMLVRFFYELLEGSLVNYSAFVPIALIAGLLAQSQPQANSNRRPDTDEPALSAAGH